LNVFILNRKKNALTRDSYHIYIARFQMSLTERLQDYLAMLPRFS